MHGRSREAARAPAHEIGDGLQVLDGLAGRVLSIHAHLLERVIITER
jgi:hypothetical protein